MAHKGKASTSNNPFNKLLKNRKLERVGSGYLLNSRESRLNKLSKEIGAKGKLNDLSVEASTFFEFLALIVDIKYRHRYGKTFDDQHGRGYSKDVQTEVLADQVSPVNDGLLGHN